MTVAASLGPDAFWRELTAFHREGLHQCPGAAGTEDHRLGSSNNRNGFSPSSGGQSLKSRCRQGHTLRGSLLPLPASGGPKHSVTYRNIPQSLPLSSRGLPCVSMSQTSLSFPFSEITGFRVHEIIQDDLGQDLSLNYPCKFLNPSKDAFRAFGVRI